MGLGFRAQPQGIQALVERFRSLEKSVAAVRRLALSSTAPAVAGNSVTGLNGSSDQVMIVEVHIATPAGFSRALVTANGSSGASCDVSGGTFIQAAVLINNAIGFTHVQWVPAGFGGGTGCSFARVVEGLDGGADVGVGVATLQTSPADVIDGTVGGDLSVSVLFLR